MFAGAVREAVFSNPDVIRRVNADFVPVALKAGLVNNPPDDEEAIVRLVGAAAAAQDPRISVAASAKGPIRAIRRGWASGSTAFSFFSSTTLLPATSRANVLRCAGVPAFCAPAPR